MAGANKAAAKAMMARNAKKEPKDAKTMALYGAGIAVGVGFLLVFLNPTKGGASPVHDAGLVDHVNRNAKTWKAGMAPMFASWTVADVRELGNVGWRDVEAKWTLCPPPAEESLPTSFDAREKWSTCFHDTIYESGNCSSSWAIAAAASVSSRYCINEPEKYPQLQLSPQSFLSCDAGNEGCAGGGMDTVWSHFQEDGAVSEACFPTSGWGAECSSACTEETPLKIQAKCAVQNVDGIKRELAANGPVAVQLKLSDELLVYKSGIFVPTTTATVFTAKRQRQPKTSMALLVGWGVDGDLDYWIVQNSWGKQWGEEGFGRIAYSLKADPSEQRDADVVLTDVAFVGYPENQKFGGQASGAADYDDLEFDDDLDDLDLDLDADDDDLFADLDLDDAEE